MEASSTYSTSSFLRFYLSLIVLLCGMMSMGLGQTRQYAEWTPSSGTITEGLLGPGGAGVTNPGNAATPDVSEWATMRAEQATIVVPVSKGGAYLQLKFDDVLPARTTTFIRISEPRTTGVNIGVLGLLSLVGDGITAVAYQNAGDDGSDVGTAIGGSVIVKTVIDVDGDHYFAVTPTAAQPYNSIRLNVRLPSDITVLSLNALEIDVFHAFYNNVDPLVDCIGEPWGTDEGFATGIGLNLGSILGNLGLTLGDLVQNPTHAIDNDKNTASILAPGVLGVANTTSQTILFNGLGESTDEVYALLSLNASLLQLGIGNNVTVQAYNGEVAVGSSATLQSLLLDLDLLSLFADERKIPVYFAPGGEFDRVVISINNLIGSSLLSGGLSIWDVERTPASPTLTVGTDGILAACLGDELTLTASNNASNATLVWYDHPIAGNEIGAGTSVNVTASGNLTYYVAARSNNASCPTESERIPITVQIPTYPLISLNGAAVYTVPVGESLTFPTATAEDENGDPVGVGWSSLTTGAPAIGAGGGSVGPFATAGTYVYRVSAAGPECENYVSVTVNVYDPLDCPPIYNRIYADIQETTQSYLLGLIQIGRVENAESAVTSPNRIDYSVLSETLGSTLTDILNLTGETSQTLSWNNTTVPAGTSLTVKLARQLGSVAEVFGGIYVQAVNNGVPVGERLRADANVAAVLGGHNDFEFTFVPADASGVPVAYTGVKVSLGAIVGAVNSVRLYHAYYQEITNPADYICPVDTYVDILTGFETLISGLNLATGLTAVNNPESALDGDWDTYASLTNAVGVNAFSHLDVTFAAPAIAGDTLKIKAGFRGGLLDLGLLHNTRIQRYLGNVAVGEPIPINSGLLKLTLLAGDQVGIFALETDQPFDRIKITHGGLADALDVFDVYEIALYANTQIPGADPDNYLEICPNDGIAHPPTDNCGTTFKFYDAETDGDELTLDDIAALAPSATPYEIWIQPVRFGCESMARGLLQLQVNDGVIIDEQPAPLTLISSGTPVTLEVGATSTSGATLSYQWQQYDTDADDWIDVGTNAATYAVTVSGAQNDEEVFRVIVSDGSTCEAISENAVIRITDRLAEFSSITKVKTAPTGNPVAGRDQVTYTITATMAGPSDLIEGEEIFFQDIASVGQEIDAITITSPSTVSYNGDFDPATGHFSFTVNTGESVPAGADIEFTITADVLADAPDQISNEILVWNKDKDPLTDPEDARDETDPIDVDRDYGFDDDALEKVGTFDSGVLVNAVAGEPYTYTVTVTNKGPSVIAAGTDIYFQDAVSPGQTLVDVTYNVGTVTPAADGRFDLTLAAAVAVGGTFTFDVTVDVNADGPATIWNTIRIWQDDPGADLTTPDGEKESDPIPVDRDYGFDDDALEKVGTFDSGVLVNAVAGEPYTYTVTVTNKGPSVIAAGTDIYFQDAVSPGQTLVGVTYNGGTVTPAADGRFDLTLASAVAVGGTFTFDVTVDVDADGPATIWNTIRIWQDDPGTDLTTPDGEKESDPIPVDQITDLSVNKTVDNTTPYVGSNVVFTVVATNSGPSDATGAVVTDDLPSGYDYVSSTVTGGTFDAAAGTWTIGGLASGASETLTITARVLAAGDYINYASIDGNEDDPDGDNNDDTPDDPVVPIPVTDLAIVKTVDNTAPYVGDNVVFTVVATNNGPSDATGAVVTDDLPSGYDYVSSTVTGGTFDAAAGTWTIGGLASGASETLTITARVLAAGDYINYASIDGNEDDPDGDNNDDTPDDPVVPIPVTDLAIVKTVDNTAPYVGDNVVFTVVATNNGPSDATGAVVTDDLPSGYDYVSSTVTGGTFDAAAGTWTIGGLASGASETLTITARVLAAGDYINYASIDGNEDDPDGDNNDDTPDDPVVPIPVYKLSIDKAADQARVKAGTNTTFTVIVTNNGPSVIEAGETIRLVERPSTGVTITGYEVVSGAATIVGTINTAVLTTTGNISVGGDIVVRITAAVAADAPAMITNGIDVWGPDKDPDTDKPDDGDETPEIPVDPDYTFTITKVADQARVQAGTTTSFTVTITNNGPSSAASGSAIRVMERPGEGVTITGYEVTSGNATVAGTGNTATVNTTATIPAQGTVVLTITAAIADDAEGTITNGVAVWAPGKDPGDEDPDDETETPEIPVDPNRSLSITKVADEETAIAGSSTSFTVTVRNNGPSRIVSGEAIRLAERPDAGIVITGYEVTSGNATVNGNGNSATLTTTSAIAANGTVTVRVTADVTAAAGESISNGIAVWGPDKNPDTDEEDDETETPEIPVVAPYTLSIEKEGDQSIVEAGKSTSFTVTITNNGPLDIEAGKDIALAERPGTGVTITGYEIVSGAATIAGNGNAATITTNGVMGAGSTIVVRITADVAETANGTITNGIRVWGPDRNPDTEDPDDEDDTSPIPIDATLEIPNLFTPNGDGLNDRFVVKNLTQYGNRELLVLNRWGNQVYKSTNYNNDWDGGTLAEGTYYYIIRVRNGNGEWQTFKGAVALIRVTNR